MPYAYVSHIIHSGANMQKSTILEVFHCLCLILKSKVKIDHYQFCTIFFHFSPLCTLYILCIWVGKDTQSKIAELDKL